MVLPYFRLPSKAPMIIGIEDVSLRDQNSHTPYRTENRSLALSLSISVIDLHSRPQFVLVSTE